MGDVAAHLPICVVLGLDVIDATPHSTFSSNTRLPSPASALASSAAKKLSGGGGGV